MSGRGGASPSAAGNLNQGPISSNAKLALIEGRKTRNAELRREALALLDQYRKDPALHKLRPSDLLGIMEAASHARGSGHTQTMNIRGELVYLLRAQSKLAIPAICEVLGISTATLFALRRKDLEIDQIVRDYQAAFFEDEAMTGEAGIHPALTIFGLKARAGWIDAKDNAITLEQMQQMAERFVQIVRDEVKDPAIIDRIVRRLSSTDLEEAVPADVTP